MKKVKSILMSVIILTMIVSCASVRKDREGFIADAAKTAEASGQYGLAGKIADTVNNYVYGRIFEGDAASMAALSGAGISLTPTFNTAAVTGEIKKFTFVMIIKKDNSSAEFHIFIEMKDREIPVYADFDMQPAGIQHTAGTIVNFTVNDEYGSAVVSGTAFSSALSLTITVDGNIPFAEGFPVFLRNDTATTAELIN